MCGEAEEKPLRLSKPLFGAGAAQSFSDSLSHRFITLFAVAVGITVGQMGYLRAAQSLSGDVLQLLWGRMVDRYGKRVFIALGRLINGVTLAVIVFVRAPGWLIPLVIGVSICTSMALPAWSSLMGDYTVTTTRGESIGRINAVSQAGSLVAMVFALLISLDQPDETTPGSFTWVLAMAAAMSLISGVLIIFTGEKPPTPTGRRMIMRRVFEDPRLRRYLLFNIVYGVSMSFAWPLFPYVIVEKLGMRIWQVAASSLCAATFSSLSQRRIGALMDRIGRRPVIVSSRLIMAMTPLAYAFATSWIHILLAEVMIGIGMGAWMSSGPTYIIDMAPRELRATYLATNTTLFGVSAFLGSLASGQIIENLLAAGGALRGIEIGLIISALMRIATGLLFFRIYETYSKDEPRMGSRS